MTLEISLKKAQLQRYGLQKNRGHRLCLTDIKELDMRQVTVQFPETEYLSMVVIMNCGDLEMLYGAAGETGYKKLMEVMEELGEAI